MIKNFFIPTKKNNNKPYLLRKTAIVAYSILLLLVNSLGTVLGIDKVYASTINQANIVSLTNQERKAIGIQPLTVDARLSNAALAKANNMLEKQYWDHFGPNGESPWQFIKAAGYNYVYAGENLGKGFRTAEGLVEAWMASPTHKANILSANYQNIGIAVVEGTLLGKQTILVVQMFGNLTSSVQGVTEASPPPSSKPKIVTGSSKVVTPREQGEIRSIEITSPKTGQTVTDPSTKITGDTKNINGEYTISIVENSQSVGDTKATGNSWEFTKSTDWSEGEHKITATLQGTDIKSKETTFTVDSKAPTVDETTIVVEKQENVYKLSFRVIDTWESINLIINSDIQPVLGMEGKEIIEADISRDKNISTVSINLADKFGNTSTMDISEYFIDNTNTKERIIPFMNLSVKDGINVGVITFIFGLLCIEILVYIRKRKFKEATGDLFTLGVWWLIVSVALFNGFSGLIT